MNDSEFSRKGEDTAAEDSAGNDLQTRLQITFFNVNRTKFEEIRQELSMGNIETAHRLTHTLKGNAGLIGKTALQKAAQAVEQMLRNGQTDIPQENMDLLKTELDTVIEELRPLQACGKERTTHSITDKKQALALYDQLEPLLIARNTLCLKMCRELSAISEAQELVRRIEQFEFKKALETLLKLRAE